MTTAREELFRELEQTPDFVVQEVLDFLLFVKLRLSQKTRKEAIAAPQEFSMLPSFLPFIE